MSPSPDFFALKFDGPATYRITVQGLISERFSESFAGMRMTTGQDVNTAPITILAGRVQDQAELAGVLNSLYETHVPIISVENLSKSSGEESENSGLPNYSAPT
ncbi:MAG: hypothetical protein ACR2PH_12265 [Desulfobulbia bacterium]